MAERKVKPEIMHLMILSKCNYKCELCCNKLYDIEKIPVATVKELKTIHTLCITGGEPFLSRNFDKMSDEELAKALGRSVGAVKAKMRQLKLKRNND